MRSGRCVSGSYGHVGCWADVTLQLNRKCTGRSSCLLHAVDPLLNVKEPCPRDLSLYLEVKFFCVPGDYPFILPPIYLSIYSPTHPFIQHSFIFIQLITTHLAKSTQLPYIYSTTTITTTTPLIFITISISITTTIIIILTIIIITIRTNSRYDVVISVTKVFAPKVFRTRHFFFFQICYFLFKTFPPRATLMRIFV